MKESFKLLVKIGVLFFIAISCNSYNCDTLPKTFNSYEQALSIVKSSSFKYKDMVDTKKSTWIREASYYSCDEKTGFFIFLTDSKEYIHQNVPIEIWIEFKNADSYGKCYDLKIKGKYRLKI